MVAHIAAAFNWFFCSVGNELLNTKTRNLCLNLAFPFKPCISSVELLIFSFKIHKYCSGDHFPLKQLTWLLLAASCSLCASLCNIFLRQTCSSNKVNGSTMIFPFNEQAKPVSKIKKTRLKQQFCVWTLLIRSSLWQQRCVCIMYVAGANK